eukprot:SAG11_NODE_869_length_6814_cov_3.266865_3_plen_85_part_00
MDFTTFMDRRTHKSPLNLTLPCPPRYITFHFYSSPTDQFGETLREPLALASQVAAAVKKQLPTTELFRACSSRSASILACHVFA